MISKNEPLMFCESETAANPRAGGGDCLNTGGRIGAVAAVSAKSLKRNATRSELRMRRRAEVIETWRPGLVKSTEICLNFDKFAQVGVLCVCVLCEAGCVRLLCVAVWRICSWCVCM